MYNLYDHLLRLQRQLKVQNEAIRQHFELKRVGCHNFSPLPYLSLQTYMIAHIRYSTLNIYAPPPPLFCHICFRSALVVNCYLFTLSNVNERQCCLVINILQKYARNIRNIKSQMAKILREAKIFKPFACSLGRNSEIGATTVVRQTNICLFFFCEKNSKN